MAMTKFAWTAHLCGTLLWVWLFSHPNRLLYLLTPILGALMIGLHQPHVHPLIAAPFVLRLLYTRQWKNFVWFAFWYLFGAWAWYQVFLLLRPTAFAGGGDLNNLLPAQTYFIHHTRTAHIDFRAISCDHASPLGLPPFWFPFWAYFSQRGITNPRSCETDFSPLPPPSFSIFFFRIRRATAGDFATFTLLMACLRWQRRAAPSCFVARVGTRRYRKALLASLAFSLFIQIPYRVYEIRTMVRPLALTWNFISSRPTDFVIIKTSDFWYSWDLIRNDPWLQQKPFIFDGAKLTPAQWTALSSKGTVTVVGADDVKAFGVILSNPQKSLP